MARPRALLRAAECRKPTLASTIRQFGPPSCAKCSSSSPSWFKFLLTFPDNLPVFSSVLSQLCAPFLSCIRRWCNLSERTFGFTWSVCRFSFSLNFYGKPHSWICVSSIAFFGVYIALICSDSLRRSYPGNMICLGILVRYCPVPGVLLG